MKVYDDIDTGLGSSQPKRYAYQVIDIYTFKLFNKEFLNIKPIHDSLSPKIWVEHGGIS